MINLELNEFTAEDVELIQRLQAMGFSDEYIQGLYDREQKRRKESSNEN